MQHRALPANEFEIIGLFKKADIDRSGTLSLEGNLLSYYFTKLNFFFNYLII
jgi:hypothetical protein